MTSATELRWGGEHLVLYPQRALHWPGAETLFIADPHWGKAETFRHAGIAIPQGSMSDDLARLTDVLKTTHARRLVILGDFFHTLSGRSNAVLNELRAWRTDNKLVEITLVRGNHDRHAGMPPDELEIASVEEGHRIDPFVCRHHPLPETDIGAELVLAGHLHPVISLRDIDGSQLRLPCFHFGPSQAVLPAFASFSGGFAVSPQREDRIFVLVDQLVREVSK